MDRKIPSVVACATIALLATSLSPAVGASDVDAPPTLPAYFEEGAECGTDFCASCAAVAITQCAKNGMEPKWDCYPTPYGCGCRGECSKSTAARIGGIL